MVGVQVGIKQPACPHGCDEVGLDLVDEPLRQCAPGAVAVDAATAEFRKGVALPVGSGWGWEVMESTDGSPKAAGIPLSSAGAGRRHPPGATGESGRDEVR